jgi:hypothetical protein
MNFDAVIVSLESRTGEVYNLHDIKFAYEFCNTNNITPLIYNIDFDDFMESGKLIDLAIETSSSAWGLVACQYVATQLDGFILLGGDPPYLALIDGKWMLKTKEYDIKPWTETFLKYNLNGSPHILYYSTEMMFSFLLDPSILALTSGKFPGKTGTNSTKAKVYNNGSGFTLPVYDYSFMGKEDFNPDLHRIKLNGIEMMARNKLLDIKWKLHLDHFYKEYEPNWNGISLIPYTKLIKDYYASVGDK